MDIFCLILLTIIFSIDVFSLTTCLCLYSKKQKLNHIPYIIGLFHFIFPYVGYILGINLLSNYNINDSKLLIIILILILLQKIHSIISKESNNFLINNISLLIYSFSVSINSFMIGLTLNYQVSLIILICSIFSFFAFTFSKVGIIISKLVKNYKDEYANIIGILLISLLIIRQLFLS